MTDRQRLEDLDRSKLTRRRAATGPRTEIGKQRSKLNAVKYGIFSSVLLLQWESKEEFDALVSGLREHYQPVGVLEETLVDQLTSSMWRLRRLLTAEAAEIQRVLPAWDEDVDAGEITSRMILKTMLNFGQSLFSSAFLNCSVSDLRSLRSMMKQVRDSIERDGLSWERDREMLEEVFGKAAKPASDKGFLERYRQAAENNDKQAAAEALVRDIDAFLESMEIICDRWAERDGLNRLHQRDGALVPKPEIAEKLLRYQITIERSIERTMLQLERLQRTRLGQAPPPPSIEPSQGIREE